MSLKKSFSYFILLFFCHLALAITTVYAQNAGTILRQEQELEKRKNLPTQIPKSLLENKDKKKASAAGEKILVNSFKFEAK